MNYSPGVAAALYEEGQHPRLFISPEDLPALRRRVRRGRARALAERTVDGDEGRQDPAHAHRVAGG